MRWFLAVGAVVCAVIIWVQISAITKPEPATPVAQVSQPAETPLTAPEVAAIVPPSAKPDEVPAPAPAAQPVKAAETTKDVPSQLQTSATMPPAPAAAASDGPDTRLAASIQTELKRLGCYYGDIDNEWSRSTRRAVRRFARRTDGGVDDSRPSQQMLTMLRGYESNGQCRTVVRAGEQPAAEKEASAQTDGAPAKDDAYLPPWMSNKGRNSSQTSSNAAGGDAASGASADAPVQESPKPEKEKRRPRRHHGGGGNPFTAIGNALGL
jgi:hypothetical protein